MHTPQRMQATALVFRHLEGFSSVCDAFMCVHLVEKLNLRGFLYTFLLKLNLVAPFESEQERGYLVFLTQEIQKNHVIRAFRNAYYL